MLCVAIEAKRQTDERDWNSIVDTDCIYYCSDTGAGTVCMCVPVQKKVGLSFN